VVVIKTLVNCNALLGEDARPSDGPVDIVIDGNRIRDIGPTGRRPPEGEVIDMKDRLVTAGLINCHHHSSEGYYKGRKDNLPLELWFQLRASAEGHRFHAARNLFAHDDRGDRGRA
jgi:guanine deaminase